jgi:predicted nucleic acid-binding protein
MEHLVCDSSVIVASLIESEEFHQRGLHYLIGLENSEYAFHMPMLVAIAVASAIGRRSSGNRQAILAAWHRNIEDWERDGKIVLYTLGRVRMEHAVVIAEQDRLRGADSVIAALAEELSLPLKTFDQEMQRRFAGASG